MLSTFQWSGYQLRCTVYSDSNKTIGASFCRRLLTGVFLKVYLLHLILSAPYQSRLISRILCTNLIFRCLCSHQTKKPPKNYLIVISVAILPQSNCPSASDCTYGTSAFQVFDVDLRTTNSWN